MKTDPVPYRRMIFVCTNAAHDGDRPVCAAGCSEDILKALKEEVKKRGLKGKVRALKSGCMDLCEKGPNVMVFPEGTLHSGVKPEDVPALIQKYLPAG
jgi:(2Fe-2S) ferredoxin